MALGSIGLSLDDFDALTPGEFDAVYTSFDRTCLREPWEQVRFLSTSILSPYSKKALKATDVLRLPWDDERHVPKEKVSKEEARARYESLIKRIHDKDIHSITEDAQGETKV